MTWQVPGQRGRTVIITGGNAGLGRQIATELAAAGAAVILACRNAEKAEAAAGHTRA